MLSLDQLKESYQLLNEELSKQQVVNESLMNSIIEKCRTKIKKESSWMYRWSIANICGPAVFLLIALGYGVSMDFSTHDMSVGAKAALWVVFLILPLALLSNLWSLNKIKGLREVDLPIEELASRVINFKRSSYRLHTIARVVCLVVVAAYFYYMNTQGLSKEIPLSTQAVCGLLFGGMCLIVGFLMTRWATFKPLKDIEDSCKELSDAENISETPDKEN